MHEIISLLRENGPLTGKELIEKSRNDALSIWRDCYKSEKILTKTVGRRYLRLDRRVRGYARLSPSILREFLTYTVMGLCTDFENINAKAKDLSRRIEKISREKFGLSKEIISQLVKSQKNHEEIVNKAVFVIAGDVPYNMAHSEPRPESSTGEMVKGSDLDIIVVTEDLTEDIIKELDRSIYHKKYYLLKMPAYREEIDYIIKDMSRVKDQSNFNSFESMVASKILCEGKLLLGSKRLFENIKEILLEKNIPQKLASLENTAIIAREKAKSYLLNGTGPISQDEYKILFYTTEETEEIF
jgi:vacuolar-type H+-ATPase subunit F/Vma7